MQPDLCGLGDRGFTSGNILSHYWRSMGEIIQQFPSAYYHFLLQRRKTWWSSVDTGLFICDGYRYFPRSSRSDTLGMGIGRILVKMSGSNKNNCTPTDPIPEPKCSTSLCASREQGHYHISNGSQLILVSQYLQIVQVAISVSMLDIKNIESFLIITPSKQKQQKETKKGISWDVLLSGIFIWTRAQTTVTEHDLTQS